MIRTDFLTDSSGELTGFRMTGHSGNAEIGTDIVCAAVSSAAYMAANTITDVVRADAQVTADDGFMQVTVAAKSLRDCRCILEGFKLHMIGLEEQYPENIFVSYMEV